MSTDKQTMVQANYDLRPIIKTLKRVLGAATAVN